mgnify:CR=1 FL=1
MFKIRTYDNISDKGISRLPKAYYEISDSGCNPDAFLLRSQKLSPQDTTPNLVAVGRAGAGVNNIPVSDYTAKGIVVFNTPGANANAVKELVMAGLLLSCRGIIPGIEYVNSLGAHQDKQELDRLVETSKKQYKGRELKARSLGILGLGAIGSMVADMALHLEMSVLGYDPALSVEAAWRLSSRVERMDSMAMLLGRSDIVTLHVPALDSTRGMINAEAIDHFRHGAVLLNFSREEIVDSSAIARSLESGRISQYISDFPTLGLIGRHGVISTPHLGASTDEAEENCAVMVADQIRDFLENGNIRNSVNFPSLNLERTKGCYRIAYANNNVPRILGSVLSILADRDINVVDMLNKSREDVAYNIIDIETKPTDELVAEILAIDGVVKVRTFAEVEG